MNNSDKSNPEKKNKPAESEPLPPSIQRRRKNHRLYKRKAKSATYDKMIVAVAFLVAVFMVLTRGCAGPIQNLTKFFSDQEAAQKEKDPNSQNNSKHQDSNRNDSK
ncbi:MAG: hypothetical protein ACQES9_05045 [Myxococcota bacterium]